MHYKFLKVPVTTLKPYAQTTPPLHPPPQKKEENIMIKYLLTFETGLTRISSFKLLMTFFPSF